MAPYHSPAPASNVEMQELSILKAHTKRLLMVLTQEMKIDANLAQLVVDCTRPDKTPEVLLSVFIKT